MATVILIELDHALLLAGFLAIIAAIAVFLLRGMEQNRPQAMPLFALALLVGAGALSIDALGSAIAIEATPLRFGHAAGNLLHASALIISVEAALRLFCQRSRLGLMVGAIAAATLIILAAAILDNNGHGHAIASELITLVVMLAGAWWLLSTPQSASPHYKRLTTLVAAAYATASVAEIYLITGGYWLTGAAAVQVTPSIALMLVSKLLLPAAFTAIVLLEINNQNVLALRRRVDTDSLTHLTSRGSLNERGESLIERTRLKGKLVAVLMLDIDHFKRVNDTHGHKVGDHVLEHCAQVMRQSLRPEAVIARYGGEEFCAIVPINNEQDSWIVAERLRQAVQSQPYRQPRQRGANGKNAPEPLMLPITISIGGTIARQGEQLDQLLAMADQELYKSKRAGRNRVTLATHKRSADAEELFVV